MKNTFTKEEIQNSVEYRWRKSLRNRTLALWGVIAGITIFMALFMGLTRDLEMLWISLCVGLGLSVLYGVVCLPFAIYYGCQMRRLVKHYPEWTAHEAVLDMLSVSYAYKRSMYYTVKITEGGKTRKVCTHACFGGAYSAFPVEEYSNQRVVGVYDEEKDVFYVVKKAE